MANQQSACDWTGGWSRLAFAALSRSRNNCVAPELSLTNSQGERNNNDYRPQTPIPILLRRFPARTGSTAISREVAYLL